MASLREIILADPFAVLGVPEDAGDDAVKQRYLALVRAFPPDREPERFQTYRRAYEAIRDARGRAAVRLLHSTDAALRHLKRHCLAAAEPAAGRVADGTVRDLLIEALGRIATD